MRNVFLDANVVIDALLEVDEHMDAALRILSLAEQGVIEICCSLPTRLSLEQTGGGNYSVIAC